GTRMNSRNQRLNRTGMIWKPIWNTCAGGLMAMLMVLAVATVHAEAQQAAAPETERAVSRLSLEQQSDIETLAAEALTLEGEIDANQEEDSRLLEIRLRLEEIADRIAASRAQLEPRLEE